MNANYNYLAKDRLLAKIDAEIERLEMSGRVNDQMVVMKMRDDRDVISKLNRVEAFRVEKEIIDIESFAPVSVHPSGYVGFIKRDIERPTNDYEISRGWTD